MNLIVSSFYNPGHSPNSTVLCNHEMSKYSLLEHCTKQVVTQYEAVAQTARNLGMSLDIATTLECFYVCFFTKDNSIYPFRGLQWKHSLLLRF